MNKRNAPDETSITRQAHESGTHTNVRSAAGESMSDIHVIRHESSVTGLAHETWRRVAYWLERMEESDPRRRLLQLAQLRRDVNLAEALLRSL